MWRNYMSTMENNEKKLMHSLAAIIIRTLHEKDNTGRLLYLFCKNLYSISKLPAYNIPNKHKFVVLTEDEYKDLIRKVELYEQ